MNFLTFFTVFKKRGYRLLFLTVLAMFFVKQALASPVIFSETFDTDVNSTTEFENTYEDFLFTSSEDLIKVVNGAVEMSPLDQRLDILKVTDGFPGDVIISADIGSKDIGEPGFYNVGLYIGWNIFLFHPGLGGGAFRIEGPAGRSNANMGFTPATDVLHHMEVRINADTGVFDITVTDGNNSNNVYTTSLTNRASVGGIIGFHGDGFSIGVGIYDNLIVQSETVVPEPTTIVIDIKPKHCPNILRIKHEDGDSGSADNSKSSDDKKGGLKVAILGTQDFDVRTIDVTTLSINGVTPVKSKFKDVTAPSALEPCDCERLPKDTYEDLILKFNRQDIIASLGTVQDGDAIELVLMGNLLEEHGSTAIEGKDCVLIGVRGDGNSGSGHKKKKNKKKHHGSDDDSSSGD